MSTRCQIGFYESGEEDLSKFEALIYRHCDGYPGKLNEYKGGKVEYGVLSDIMPILRDFNKNRGLGDVEYASAWLVAKLKGEYTNIGICRVFHADIEYFYAVYPDKVDVYETPFDAGCERWRKIRTVKI